MHYFLLLKTYSFVIASWLFICLILIGLGIYIVKFFAKTPLNSEHIFSSFWVGFSILIFILQIWHMFFKINLAIFIIISIAGLLGIAFNFKLFLGLFKGVNLKKLFLFLFIVLGLAIWFTHRAILPPLNYDSGAWHIQNIKWIYSYPLVPGLGNLQMMFGWNVSSFLYVAFLESGFWSLKSSYISNGVFMIFITSYIIFCIFKFFSNRANTNKTNIKFYNIFIIIMLAPILRESWIGNLSSPSYDLPLFLIEIAVGYFFLRFLENYKNSDDFQDFDMFTILIICILGITIKLQFIVFGALIFIVTLILWLLKVKNNFRMFKLKFIFTICLSGIGLIYHIIRGMILSGYPFFPVAFTPFNFDWKIPKSIAISATNVTVGWARIPGANSAAGWGWVRDWFMTMVLSRLEMILPIIFILASLIIFLVFYKKNKNITHSRKIFLIFPIPFILSIAFWFFTAPDPRYVGSIIWVFAVGLFVMALIFSDKLKGPKLKTKVLILLLSVFISFINIWYYLPLKGEKEFAKSLISEKNIVKAFGELYFENHYYPISNFKRSWNGNAFYDIPEAKVKEFKTNSGLIIYVPEKTYDVPYEELPWGTGLAWYAPLPYAGPNPNPNLELRVDNNLRYGFKIKE